MENITEQLLKIKKDIENKKAEKSKLEGKLQTLQEQMEKDFDCMSIEEGGKKLKDLERNKTEKEKILKAGLEKLETEYEW